MIKGSEVMTGIEKVDQEHESSFLMTRKHTIEWKGGKLKTDKPKYFHLVPWQISSIKGATELQNLARLLKKMVC